MIIKKRDIPEQIHKLEALLHRLEPNHPSYQEIQEAFARKMAGYKGELSLDYPLSLLTTKRYSILHDLRLPHQGSYFQIDSLLLSKQFLLLIEVKNFLGSLYFDCQFHQLIRTIDDKEETYPDPLIQVYRHEHQLRQWLRNHKLPEIPILSLIVIGSPYTRIQANPQKQNLSQKVIHSQFLPERINQLEQTHTHERLDDKDIKRISKLLLKQNEPDDSSMMKRYRLVEKDIKRGTMCPECTHIPMDRQYNTWICLRCNHKCKQAHLTALRDYALLISKTITNKQARDFLLIDDSSLTKRLLRDADYPSFGEKKGRYYKLR